MTPTATALPVTMIAGQSLSCVKGPHWILFEWVTGIAEGETVTLLARATSYWPDYYYVRKSNGTECWAHGGSSTINGDPSKLPEKDAPPLPTVAYTIENQTHMAVCDVYIKGKDEAAWGADRLRAGTVNPGATFSLDITAGFYDVLIHDCKGSTLYEKDNTPIGSDANYHYTLLNNQGTISITNHTAFAVCKIIAWPKDGDPGVGLFKPSDGSIVIGGSPSFTITVGIYLIQYFRCGDLAFLGQYDNIYIGPLGTTSLTVH